MKHRLSICETRISIFVQHNAIESYNTPYYAVIFTSLRTEVDNGYAAMALKMEELAKQQEGFLGVESACDGIGSTVSYWRDLDCIRKWKQHEEHLVAQSRGRSTWYSAYRVRIAKVEREYGI